MSTYIKDTPLRFILIVITSSRLILTHINAGVSYTTQIMILANNTVNTNTTTLRRTTIVGYHNRFNTVGAIPLRVSTFFLNTNGTTFKDLTSFLIPLFSFSRGIYLIRVYSFILHRLPGP